MFGLGQQSKSPNVTAQHRLNVYYEISPQEDKTQVTAYGTPGLELNIDFGETPARGMWSVNDFNYVVHRGTLWRVNNAGVQTMLGSLDTSSGQVYMKDNGVQLMIVDGSGGYIYNMREPAPVTITSITHSGTTATVTTATDHGLDVGQSFTESGASPSQYNGTFVVTEVPSATTFKYEMLSAPATNATVVGAYTINYFQKITAEGFPTSPETVDFIGGKFVISLEDSGRFYSSGIYNGLTWDALDYANAESNPDNLVRVFVSNGALYLLGKFSTELWGVSGGEEFSFSLIDGSAKEWGLAARASVSKFNDGIIFLARSRMGECKVVMMQGLSMSEASDQAMDNIFNGYTDIENAVGFSYMMDGHPFYQITFPSPGITWLYDGSTSAWTQLQSKGITRHRAQLQTNYLNDVIVSDYENGSLYKLKGDVYTDNGEEIAREITGKHIFSDMKRVFIGQFQADMETGVGLQFGQGSDPQIMLKTSTDNGHTWSLERWKPLGAVGQYRTRVIWTRVGMAFDTVFKLRMTDPVKFVLTGAYLEMEVGK